MNTHHKKHTVRYSALLCTLMLMFGSVNLAYSGGGHHGGGGHHHGGFHHHNDGHHGWHHGWHHGGWSHGGWGHGGYRYGGAVIGIGVGAGCTWVPHMIVNGVLVHGHWAC